MPYPNRVFVNSLPKSGSFLLSKAVELFGYRDYYDADPKQGDTPRCFNYREVRDALTKRQEPSVKTDQTSICAGSQTPLYVRPDIFKQWLSAVSDGWYIAGHVSYSSALGTVLAELNYRHVFIIRDPRAVLPSLLSFILNTRGLAQSHYLEPDFKPMSPTQRMNFILEGGYARLAGVEVKSFAQVYRSMLAWQNDPDCLVVHFEDLIGEQGGGSAAKQEAALRKIADHLGLPFDTHKAAEAEKIYNPSAPTFRIGQIDSWKHSMEPEAVKRVSEYCEPLCQEAGYDFSTERGCY
ncbi:MAG: sulfotransferase [Desulfobacteraceae bacterium]|nr:sulfotransferase [Desulfobacteraceae bacterium]